MDTGSGAVACVAADPLNPGQPGSRIEQWFPLSAGSHYLETGFSSVWAAIGSKVDFPDTCTCANHQDNGAGLSWGVDVAAGGSVTKSHYTTFSPLGVTPLTMTKTALPTSVAAGGTTTYTIVVTNHNASPATLTSVSDTLPEGFGYVTGSTSGMTTTNPVNSSGVLTWSGSFPVAANSTASLSFTATVSSTPGSYTNSASADAGAVAVVGTGSTASVTVTAPVNHPPVAVTDTLTTAEDTAGSSSRC